MRNSWACRDLTVVDEYTRECLALERARSLAAREVLRVLRQLVARYGSPRYLRSDNGPEFIARRVRGWLAKNPEVPVSRFLVDAWWDRAERLGKLAPEPGRGWHSCRRTFATELKAAPLKDLCALGGWKDPQTILKCYQRADPVTMRHALTTRIRLEREQPRHEPRQTPPEPKKQ